MQTRAIQERMRTAFDLYEAAEQMMRHRLRREDPSASESLIEKRVVEWLRTRPKAPTGDAEGPHTVPVEPSRWVTGSSKL